MARSLTQAVIAGGVVYPAGTPATAELEKAIPAKFWDGEPVAEQEVVRISEGYDDHKVAVLEGEIKARNAERDEADHIVPDGTKRADLIAALEADDAAQAES